MLGDCDCFAWASRRVGVVRTFCVGVLSGTVVPLFAFFGAESHLPALVLAGGTVNSARDGIVTAYNTESQFFAFIMQASVVFVDVLSLLLVSLGLCCAERFRGYRGLLAGVPGSWQGRCVLSGTLNFPRGR